MGMQDKICDTDIGQISPRLKRYPIVMITWLTDPQGRVFRTGVDYGFHGGVLRIGEWKIVLRLVESRIRSFSILVDP